MELKLPYEEIDGGIRKKKNMRSWGLWVKKAKESQREDMLLGGNLDRREFFVI